jgi:hypothetical protein
MIRYKGHRFISIRIRRSLPQVKNNREREACVAAAGGWGGGDRPINAQIAGSSRAWNLYEAHSPSHSLLAQGGKSYGNLQSYALSRCDIWSVKELLNGLS